MNLKKIGKILLCGTFLFTSNIINAAYYSFRDGITTRVFSENIELFNDENKQYQFNEAEKSITITKKILNQLTTSNKYVCTQLEPLTNSHFCNNSTTYYVKTNDGKDFVFTPEIRAKKSFNMGVTFQIEGELLSIITPYGEKIFSGKIIIKNNPYLRKDDLLIAK